MADDRQLKVTQVRSAIGAKPKQRGTLRALGLATDAPPVPTLTVRGERAASVPTDTDAAAETAE